MTITQERIAELRPCPFCGGEAMISHVEAHNHSPILKKLAPHLPPAQETFWAECPSCGAAISGEPTEAEAIAAWNTRAESKDAAEQSLRLEEEVARLRADKARLDFLDECNQRLNARYGSNYGWSLILNHNVNRLMLGDQAVDLHDMEGRDKKLPSCRDAIDREMERIASARATLRREQRHD